DYGSLESGKTGTAAKRDCRAAGGQTSFAGRNPHRKRFEAHEPPRAAEAGSGSSGGRLFSGKMEPAAAARRRCLQRLVGAEIFQQETAGSNLQGLRGGAVRKISLQRVRRDRSRSRSEERRVGKEWRYR